MFSNLRRYIPHWLVNSLWHLPKAVLANLVYGFPSKKLVVIGVTGTSGKTTTAHLIYHLLAQSGFKTALISTIAAKIGQQEIPTGLHVTNPDSFALQKLLKKIADKRYQYVVLEVTSHGLAQHRAWGINFTYGVLLNLTHEHLDYHKTFKNYQQAKLKLIKHSDIAVLNQTDKSFSLAKQTAKNKVLTFNSRSNQTCSSLPGSFNCQNINAAVAVAQDLGIKLTTIKKSLKTFKGLPGRMEFIQTQPFTIIIDFAHKPDALEKALLAVKDLKSKTKTKAKKGRIISVFGCAGLRDIKKRPLMGKISSQLADITILTAEDPRTEDVNKIIDQIAAGFIKTNKNNKKSRLLKIPDRQQAINQAIQLAQPGDYVVLFGKAHEKSMCFGTIEHPWSEHQAVKKALKLKS